MVPLAEVHAAGLWCAVGRDSGIWNWFTSNPQSPEEMKQYIAKADCAFSKGERLPFACIINGEVAGSTSYRHIEVSNSRLEIGSTFFGSKFQGGPYNVESKLLLLDHAFNELEVNRVETIVAVENSRSQHAVEKLGFKLEGTLRQYIKQVSGSADVRMYSILRDEWPEKRPLLVDRIKQKSTCL
nr:GNAT family protein [Shimazuella soli]